MTLEEKKARARKARFGCGEPEFEINDLLWVWGATFSEVKARIVERKICLSNSWSSCPGADEAECCWWYKFEAEAERFTLKSGPTETLWADADGWYYDWGNDFQIQVCRVHPPQREGLVEAVDYDS